MIVSVTDEFSTQLCVRLRSKLGEGLHEEWSRWSLLSRFIFSLVLYWTLQQTAITVYRVIKKSLHLTITVQIHVHRDFLITLYTRQIAYYSFYLYPGSWWHHPDL